MKPLSWPWAEIGKSGPHKEPIWLQDSLPRNLGKKKKKDSYVHVHVGA